MSEDICEAKIIPITVDQSLLNQVAYLEGCLKEVLQHKNDELAKMKERSQVLVDALQKITKNKHKPIYKTEDCTIGACDCFFRISKEALHQYEEVGK